MSSKKTAILQKHDNDVVIVTAVRSAITKVCSFSNVILISNPNNSRETLSGQKGRFQGHQAGTYPLSRPSCSLYKGKSGS